MRLPLTSTQIAGLLTTGLATVVVAAPAAGAPQSSGPISTVAGDGSTGLTSSLNAPGEVALAEDGSVLVADTLNHRVRRISPLGVIDTVAGTGLAGSEGDGGPARLATLREPSGVAALPDGGFLVVDRGNHRVRQVSAAGFISTVAGTGFASSGGEGEDRGDGGPAISATLKSPEDVSPTADGGFLVADTGNDLVRKVSADGTIHTVAGGASRGGEDVPAASAELDDPKGVAALRNGGYLIADSASDRIRQVSPSGTIATVAGSGANGFSGDGGPALSALLSEPSDVVSAAGGFLVADTRNHRIRLVSSSGSIETIAGTGAAGYNGDGMPPTAASLNAPLGVALSATGEVYVADTDSNRVRRFATGLRPTTGALEPPGRRKREPGAGGSRGLAPPAPPVAGKRLNAAPVAGVVRVRTPRAKGFRRLTDAASIPVGSRVDARTGVVRLTAAADLEEGVQRAIFYRGEFAIRQERSRRPVTELRLRGGSFAACRRGDGAAAAAGSRRRARRGLWGRGHGRFRTRGRYGAATVRGTIWFTGDRCKGTLVRVRRGVVAVDDFARDRVALVRAGGSYLARARGKGRG